jgi:hypothetical protein
MVVHGAICASAASLATFWLPLKSPPVPAPVVAYVDASRNVDVTMARILVSDEKSRLADR